jgi:hypothetical protein
MPKISIFNGGLRTAAAAHLIADKESVINVNMDHISGVITPLLDKTEAVLNAKQWGHFFTTELEWYFDDAPKDWVEFQERLYIGNRSGFSTKIVDGNEWLMGIVGPTLVPTGVVSDETPDQDQITRCKLTSSINVAADIPGGELMRYKIVNINAAGQYYAADREFSIRIPEGSDTNEVQIFCTDTNIQDEVAIYRFFDNYWRLIWRVADPSSLIDGLFDISANAEWDAEVPGNLNGVYQYALTWYNTVDGTESVPVISEEIEVNWGTITVSNLEVPAADPQINLKRLYRIGGSSTAFTRVTDLAIGVTSYIDILADDELEGTLLESENNYAPVENMHWMMESYAMLFAADGDKLRFTPIGEANNWPQTYFLDFPRIITGLAKTPIGILVFNMYETWLVTGTGPLSLSQQLLTGSQGCINGDSVVNIEGAAYWASTDGVCLSDGGQVQVITRTPLDKLDLTGSINAVVYDEQYYLLLDTDCLVVDINRKVIKNTQYNIESFIIANDILYGYTGDALHEIESSVNPLPLQYRSPEYIGIAFTVPKIYKNIFVFSEGELTASVYIDKVLAQTSVLETAYGNHQFKIPDIASKGHSIQFEIIGTGTVYEIEWMDGNANK